ncbi:MAG: RdgB/HAM1 family non-canonical purine NTP pyrophosphatase [Fastidiosipilaceae bacterium]|jgi:XTP/dITP diphosphohydrolase
MKLVVATHNRDKIKEIKAILKDLPFEVMSQKDVGFDEEVIEDGVSFPANALIKAKAVHPYCPDAYVMADDSGLCVDALGGAPGIYSSRFAGEETDYPTKFKYLWDLLASVDPDDWTARFICAVAVVRPDGSAFTVLGEMAGCITDTPRGQNGFGYDPIFYLPNLLVTSAELPPELKNMCSHRGVAVRKMAKKLLKETK